MEGGNFMKKTIILLVLIIITLIATPAKANDDDNRFDTINFYSSINIGDSFFENQFIESIQAAGFMIVLNLIKA